MRKKLLFAAKLLFSSLALFTLWKAPFPLGLGVWYTRFLNFSVISIYPIFLNRDASFRILDKVPYYFIPFASLIIATPEIKTGRRIKLILAGFAVFFAFDFLTTIFGITNILKSGQTSLTALYHTILLILPFILWLIPLYNDLLDFWNSDTNSSLVPLNSKCPICGKMKTDLVEHIRAAHGNKSLKKHRVKRFLAKQNIKP